MIALGPHWSLQEPGDGELWVFSERGDDVPIPIHELDEIKRMQLETGTDWRGCGGRKGRHKKPPGEDARRLMPHFR